VANFLFLGPTGTGKTRTVEAMAEALVGTSKAVLKIDCAEFQHSQEIAKLIGSPPGYIGHRETAPLLSQENLNQYRTTLNAPMSFLLFDEIEKANDALWNLLLGILDKGKLTLGDNRRVDFSKTMIFLTSNLGAKEMETLVHPKLGFQMAETTADPSRLTRTATEAARRRFTPEFMNRIDKVVVFRPLEEDSLRQILDLELNFVQRRLLGIDGVESFVFTVSEAAKTRLIRLGTGARYGARHLKRVIERELVDPLANLKASGQARKGDWIAVDLLNGEDGEDEDQLVFRRRSEGLSPQAMIDISCVNPLIPGQQSLRAAASQSDEYVVQAVGRSRR
jgi:ATP-dependent Clp protease ATP-binding subunit ClpA